MHTCEVERTKHTGGRRQSSGLVMMPWKITQVYMSPEQRERKSGWEISQFPRLRNCGGRNRKGRNFIKERRVKGASEVGQDGPAPLQPQRASPASCRSHCTSGPHHTLPRSLSKAPKEENTTLLSAPVTPVCSSSCWLEVPRAMFLCPGRQDTCGATVSCEEMQVPRAEAEARRPPAAQNLCSQGSRCVVQAGQGALLHPWPLHSHSGQGTQPLLPISRQNPTTATHMSPVGMINDIASIKLQEPRDRVLHPKAVTQKNTRHSSPRGEGTVNLGTRSTEVPLALAQDISMRLGSPTWGHKETNSDKQFHTHGDVSFNVLESCAWK